MKLKKNSTLKVLLVNTTNFGGNEVWTLHHWWCYKSQPLDLPINHLNLWSRNLPLLLRYMNGIVEFRSFASDETFRVFSVKTYPHLPTSATISFASVFFINTNFFYTVPIF